MDNEEMIRMCLWQDCQGEELQMMITFPKRINDKMIEISHRSPKGTWYRRDLELKELAEKELEAEGWKPTPIDRTNQ